MKMIAEHIIKTNSKYLDDTKTTLIHMKLYINYIYICFFDKYLKYISPPGPPEHQRW